MDSSDSQIQPVLKNRKTESEGLVVEDRISQLPDGVICHILSFIPTKYSIRTCVVSKRWEHLWAFAPRIELEVYLHSENMSPEKEELDRLEELCGTFTHSVDNLFFSRDSLCARNFKLHYNGDVLPPRMRPSSWVCAIIMCNVSELDLEIGHTDDDLGELPWCLFTCKTLVTLKLCGRFILNVPHCVCLPNLKTLLLDSVIYLDDASFRKLLSGCHILEYLEIFICDWNPMVLYVCHSSLKRLSLSVYFANDRTYRGGDHRYKIVVDAPKLEFIHLENWSDDVLLKYLPNIVEARVCIVACQDIYKVLKLLQSMVNVKRLFLNEQTLRSFGFSTQLSLPTFFNLVQLELSYDTDDTPVRLMDHLYSSPKLEALYLPGGICYNGDDNDTDPEFPDHGHEHVPECLHHSLKFVRLKNFEGEEVELNTVQYLLENAMVLKKMTIFCRHKPSSLQFIELDAKLTNYARMSTYCQLDLLYQYEHLSNGSSTRTSSETSSSYGSKTISG